MPNQTTDPLLHERLLAAVGDRSYRSLAADTGHNPETVRRYMQGQAPSAEFLARVCAEYDVNAHWLVTGVGTMNQSETEVHALRGATPSALLGAVADTLERLVERVDQLEAFVQALESRLGADGRPHAQDPSVGAGPPRVQVAATTPAILAEDEQRRD